MNLLKKLSGFLEKLIGDERKTNEYAQKWHTLDQSEFGY